LAVGGGRGGGGVFESRSRLLRSISLHEVHVCPTVVEEEDGELVYRVDGC